MTGFSGALSLLLLSAGSVVAAVPSLSEQARISGRKIPELRAREKKRSKEFNRKLLSMAQPPRQLDQNYNGNYNYNNGQNDAQDGNYDNYDNGQYWNEYMEQADFGFEINQYSMKFTQCATVETYSDNLAEDEYSDTVLAAQRFALFRLCPSDQCSSRSNLGCDGNYGEYLVSMDQYLAAILEEEEQRVAGYCSYCQECATIESAKFFWQEVEQRRQTALTVAEENYEEWYDTYVSAYDEQQNQYNQDAYNNAANGYDNGNGNYDQYNEEANLALKYYSYVRDNSNYANNYYSNNYGQNGGYDVNNGSNNWSAQGQPQWDNEDFWMFQQNSKQQYSNMNAWANMGSSFGTYFGRTVVNGYFDENGDFNQQWGYFNCYGAYVSIEDEGYDWDECIWGEQPENWDNIDSDTESCNYDYAGSCYNQYEACMEILQDDNYMSYQNYKNGYSQQQQGQAQQDVKYSVRDFVQCTEINMNQNNVYANQDYYAQQYQAKQEYFQNQYQCYDGDEDCEEQREYAMNMWSYQNNKNRNRGYFIGPHCSTNGRGITFAIYKDEYCSVIDEENTVQDILGYNIAENVNLVPNDCIRCGKAEWVSTVVLDGCVYHCRKCHT